MVEPQAMRTAVEFLREQHAATERRACRLVGIERSTHRYRQRRNERREALRARLKELALERQRFGYRRLTALLRREGWRVNPKCVWLICREEGLLVRKKSSLRQLLPVLTFRHLAVGPEAGRDVLLRIMLTRREPV